jgi:hypothetical protein
MNDQDHRLSLSDPDRSLVLSFSKKFSTKFSIVSYSLKRFFQSKIQDVSEIRVLILTSGRTRQIMELFSLTFLRKSDTN